MWAIRFCLSRNALNISYPKIISASQSIPKTFSTLNCFSHQLFKKCYSPRTYKLFNTTLLRTNLSPGKAVQPATAVLEIDRRKVGLWLLFCSGMVYMTITMGAYTRLTEAGLSMVTWKLHFEKFPSTDEEWDQEFKKYQEYPEFKLLKKDITLEEFKGIFKTEYFHRTMGRGIGIIFFIPALSFWLKGLFTLKMKKRVAFMGILIVSQGLLGWYMVKSGLEDRFPKQSDVPRVSQYRLAAHLGLALTLYTTLLWTALDTFLAPIKPSVITAGMARIRTLAHACKGLVFLTALSGAFVAGLDAGLIYNSFPKMGGKWIPDDILAMSPKLTNFTENPTTVQFDHRILGITTFSLIMATWLFARRQPLPKRVKTAVNILALAACTQVTLGISTLVHNVPTHLALSHQSMSVMLLTAAIWVAHELKTMKYIPKF